MKCLNKKTILILLFVFMQSCYNVDYIKNRNNPDLSKDSDILIHKMNRKLTWDQFKGTSPDSITNMTYLHTKFQLQNNVDPGWGTSNFDAFGVVLMSESWVTPDMKNDYNLNHQQILFDISEIFAQRLENYLNSLRINPSKRYEVIDVFNWYNNELIKYQKLYKKETNNGLNSLKQLIWNKKIAKELLKLKTNPVPK